MQEFYINQHSVNPVLRMELISDGNYEYKNNFFNNSIQNADVTFSMKNVNNDILKISKAQAEIVLSEEGGCEEKYILQYTWNKRDVKEKGVFKGWFEIKFNNDLYEEGVEYPQGNLIIPIENELFINIQ